MSSFPYRLDKTKPMIKFNNMNSPSKIPLWFSLALYWLLTIGLLFASLETTNDHFGYPIDDTYIHMAIGKHFVNDGSWGVSQFGFSSSTSSPLWTFLISITYMLFGVNALSPFLLAFAAGNSILVLSHSILAKRLSSIHQTLFLLTATLLTPLAMLTLSGMEHLLHALFTILLLFHAATFLENPHDHKHKIVHLCILAALITITRYEGLFLVFSICILLLFQKRIFASLLTGTAGILPVLGYGIFSVSKGWFFLPNSILLKGNSPQLSPDGLSTFLERLFTNFLLAPHILILVAACIGIYIRAKQYDHSLEKEKFKVALLGMTATLHMQFASVGWFYRYDAYLILLTVLVLAGIAGPVLEKNHLPGRSGLVKNVTFLSLGILLAAPLAVRAVFAHGQYPTAVKNIHDQQYQMGIFLRKYYNGSVIAANDIGAINYLADVKTLDLYGLGNLEVLKAKRSDKYDAETVDALATQNKVEIVMIYDSWFPDNRPPAWIEAGKWQIMNNIACDDDTVTIYVTREIYLANAIANLQDFEKNLPDDILQYGLYTEK